MIEVVSNYAEGLGANNEVLNWVNTTGKKSVIKHKATQSDLEHIIDFFISSAAPTRLQKMSYVDAKRLSKEWSERNQKKGKHLKDSDSDIETIHNFSDGSRIVKLLTKKAYQREGFLMNHCLGGYNLSSSVHIYSYRDKENMPHATFEVQKNNNEIVQIKGKGNGSIHPKYINPILEFLRSIGMNIRPSDMVNLGYYHIDKVHLDFLKKSEAYKQVVMISGEAYAF